MKKEEKLLIYYLNYKEKESDVFIRTEAIHWFQKTFLNYWKKVDEERNSINIKIIEELYIKNKDLSASQIAKNIGIHERTLARYRNKFIAKMKDIMNDYKRHRY